MKATPCLRVLRRALKTENYTSYKNRESGLGRPNFMCYVERKVSDSDFVFILRALIVFAN